MIIRIVALIVLCLSLTACGSSVLMSFGGLGLGIAQKSTASTVYGAVDVGVSATTDKSIREHVLGDATPESEGSHLTSTNSNVKWVTPK